MRLRHRTGQSAVEYAVMIAVVIAALLALNIYIKRGFMGRYRSLGDQAGSQFSFANGTTNIIENIVSGRDENTNSDGLVSTTFTADTQNRNEVSNLSDVGNEQLFYGATQ